MKKSLVLLAVLVTTLAFASTVCAYSWACYEMPTCKVVCKDEVLCKGAAKGMVPVCGPAMCVYGKIECPSISWSGKWLTVVKCPKKK